MKRENASQRVRRAQRELSVAQECLESNVDAWQAWTRKRRLAIAAGSGFASGIALTLLPTRWWARIGALTAESAAVAARSLLLPFLVGAVLGKIEPRSSRTDAKSQ